MLGQGKVCRLPTSHDLTDNPTGKYSVADIGTWPWIKNWEKSGFTKEEMSEFPHLLNWVHKIAGRPAVQRGIGETYALKHAIRK